MNTAIHPAGPQQLALQPFVGRWRTTGLLIAPDGGEPAQMSAIDEYEWLSGGFFLLHRWDARFPDARSTGIEIIGYDSGSAAYFMRSYDSEGSAGEMLATVDGARWVFTSPSLRFKGGFDPGGAVFSGLWESRSESGEWIPWMEITLRRDD